MFQSRRRKKRQQQNLWNDYVWKKQNLRDLEEKTGHSYKWIRRQLDTVDSPSSGYSPHPVVIVADTTFWGRHYGVCVFRIPNEKKNIWWNDVDKEVMANYYYGRKMLEERGWTFIGAVVDGRCGLTTVFQDIPVQICQFHQMKQVTKYLTRRPEALAGQELRSITLTLTKSTEKDFTKMLDSWFVDWEEFITEKTYVLGTKYWYYTHKNVRGAYMSLRRNLPYLFTYLKYPELNMPNTTNCLDGSFSHLKAKLSIHRGLRKDRRYKVISEILGGKDKRKREK